MIALRLSSIHGSSQAAKLSRLSDNRLTSTRQRPTNEPRLPPEKLAA